MDAVEAEAGDQDMAQLMGFSSFGAQDRPQKKRRYNPGADAGISSAQAQAASSTGSNAIPMGTRNLAPADNADEINLDDDDDDDDADAGGAQGVFLDQAKDPDFIASGDSSEPTVKALPQGLPQRPAPGTGFVGSLSGGNPGGGQHRNEGGRGQQPWYEGYYDTLSNRNPWERLEKSMGLPPIGTWISHDGQTTGPT